MMIFKWNIKVLTSWFIKIASYDKQLNSLGREGGGAEAAWALQKWPPSLQICGMTSRPRKTVSVPLALCRSLGHFVSTPHILIFACRFLYFVYLLWLNQSRLRNSLKNRSIDKFELLIHLIDPNLFFCKKFT